MIKEVAVEKHRRNKVRGVVRCSAQHGQLILFPI